MTSNSQRRADAPAGTTPHESKGRFSHAWRAMRHRNYRLFFYGQGISLIGTWMTRVATGWLVYRLTGSAAMLGIVGFAGQIPSFLFSAFAGVWIERLDRRRLLTITQVLACIQSFGMAALTLKHIITIPEIIALSVLQGLITAFDTPTRHAFLVQMVEGKEDIGSAIALTSSLVTLARLAGPAMAGFIIAAVGEGWCFFVDGASYIAVIVSLMMMNVKPAVIARAKASVWAQMREGWTYVSGFRPIRVILLLFALTSLMGMPYMVLLPIFAGQVLHGGPHTLGYLSGAAGLGALLSSVMLAVRKSVHGLTTVIPIASAIFGAGLVLLGFSNREWFSIVVLTAVGFGMLQQMAASNTVIQTLVPEDKRARVMSYYTIAFIGVTPFGSLLAGMLASRIGAPHTVIVTGACCILGSIWFSTQLKQVNRDIRPIYVELGVYPREESATT